VTQNIQTQAPCLQYASRLTACNPNSGNATRGAVHSASLHVTT